MGRKCDLRQLLLCAGTAVVVVALLLGWPRTGTAHPMGNFSINHFSALEVHPTAVRVSYIIDMAEIPAFQEMQAHGLTAQPDTPNLAVYQQRKVQELQQGLSLQMGEQELPLTLRSSTVTFPPGAGGLPTLRISAVYEAPLRVTHGQLVYEDRNYPQRIGWKEIIATAGEGVTLSQSSVPAVSTSHFLTTYAADLLQAPPQDLRAQLSFSLSPFAQTLPALAPGIVDARQLSGEKARTSRSSLTELITTSQLSIGVIVFSLLVAMGLGAFHALEPGHGKTLVAAYLVGSQGTVWHAVVLGLTVTASHTVGVYALGGVALFASHYVLPEQLYPWLGFTSGLLIAGMGIVLLTQAWRRQHGPHHGPHTHLHHHPEHRHAHPHDHDHPHPHDHHPYALTVNDGAPVGYGALLTLGITGGMIPCPAALVVLLSAVALQRITFGLLLIVAFSIGLAVVLVGTGLLLVSAREVVQRWGRHEPWLAYLPFFSPLVITPLGVVIAVRSLASTGVVPSLPF